jgi:hypothetical protein
MPESNLLVADRKLEKLPIRFDGVRDTKTVGSRIDSRTIRDVA